MITIEKIVPPENNHQEPANEEPTIKAQQVVMNLADNVNVDTDVSSYEFLEYNSTMDLTEEQKEAWLWEDYMSKQTPILKVLIW